MTNNKTHPYDGTPLQPYSCGICGIRFFQYTGLFKHVEESGHTCDIHEAALYGHLDRVKFHLSEPVIDQKNGGKVAGPL